MNADQGRFFRRIGSLIVLIIAIGAGWYVRGVTQPQAKSAAKHEEDEHDHHHGHDDDQTLELSPQAIANMKLQTGTVSMGPFERTVTVPAMVVQQPGRTSSRVVAPLTGVITRVYAIAGEALTAGSPLFELRLTHEDLVQSQVDFLKTVEELDVVQREIARLKPQLEKGVLPLKSLLDRQYERDKLEAIHKAQKQALLLHGLSKVQVDEIVEKRELLSTVTVYVPQPDPALKPKATIRSVGAEPPEPSASPPEATRLVEELKVQKGQLVTAGDTLCVLADLSLLYIDGKGFEQDAPRVLEAVRNDWKVVGVLESPGTGETRLEGLSILYVADKVDSESRTFAFYVRLKNSLLRDTTVDGHRFINWKFKPGQRVQLRVPVESWEKRIILPAAAVAQDGLEFYVFLQKGKKLVRRAVHLEYRDRTTAIVRQDGALFPGQTVAFSGASQLLMALKNKAAGPVDPHAGHNH